MSAPIHISFASDGAGSTGLAVAAHSALKHSSRPTHIWVIEEGIGADNKAALRDSLSRHPSFASLNFIAHASLPVKLPRWWARERWPILAAARFQLADVLPPTAHRCIYLDIDVLVGTDLAELFDLDLDGHPVAMVPNTGMTDDVVEYVGRLQIDPQRYCNSGVMLMDLDRWRAEGIGRSLIEFGRRMDPDLWFYDQDMLNVYFRDRCLLLDGRWNFRDAGVPATGRIQHFAGSPKPWQTSPGDELDSGFIAWHEAREETGFRARPPSAYAARVRRLKVEWARVERRLIRLARRAAADAR